jgi:uncharacterized protein (TIGR03435 family)
MRTSTNSSRLDWANIPFRTLLGAAFRLKQYQILGPSWIGSKYYDISAKFPPDMKYDQVPAMWQALLKERFKLTFHRETRVMPTYELLAGKGDSKLHKSDETTSSFHMTSGAGRGIEGRATVSALATQLSMWLDRPLVDKTGIQGVYDVDLRWTGWEYERAVMSSAAAIEPFDGLGVSYSVDHPTIFSELRDKLGLRVQSGKGPVEVLVVDSAERVPTEN